MRNERCAALVQFLSPPSVKNDVHMSCAYIHIASTSVLMIPMPCTSVQIRPHAIYTGSAEIIDVSAELPGLTYTRGMTSWRVMARDGRWFERMEDVPEKLSTQIRPSMFPPSPDVAATLNLQRWSVQQFVNLL